MRVRYYGKQTKDIYGEKLNQPFSPFAEITCTESEFNLAVARIEYTGYGYDGFGDGDLCNFNVHVSDREDYKDFMELWKEAKRVIKK